MKISKILYLFLFFTFFIQRVQAQNIDSLENALLNAKSENQKIHTKLQLIEAYNEINPKRADSYLLSLQKKENDIVNRHDYVQYAFLKTLYYKKKGLFKESKKWIATATKLSETLKDSLQLKFRINYLSGAIADDESNIELAIKYHLKALYYAEKSNDDTHKATVLGGIGRAYMYLAAYDKAKKYLQNAIAIKKKLKQYDHHLANYYENLSSCFDEEKDYKKSLFYLNKAITIYKKNNSFVSLVSVYNNKAYTFLLMNKIKEAEKTIKRAFFLSDSIHISEEERMFPYSTYAEILFAQKKTDKALEKINKSIALSKKYKDLYLEKYNLNLLYSIYLREKNYKKALEYFQKKVVVLDTIHNLKKRKEIENLMLGYETEKKNKKILLLQKEKQINKIALTKSRWFQIALLMLMLLLLALLLLLRNRYKNKVNTELLLKESLKSNYEKIIKEAEIQTLRSQMNPHFLFNCLNSINSFIIKNNKEKASEYLLNFSSLIRNVLHNSKQTEILLSKELETLNLYVKMELLRFSDNFTFNLFVDKEVETDFIEVPPLIIQPFVENSIRHGFIGRKNGEINVHVSQEKSMLIIKVTDNGIGRAFSKKLKKGKHLQRKSYGIKITEERLMLKTLAEKSFKSIEIIDLVDSNNNPKGTQVIIRIKL